LLTSILLMMYIPPPMILLFRAPGRNAPSDKGTAGAPLLLPVVLAVFIVFLSLPAVVLAGACPHVLCSSAESLEAESILCTRKKTTERQLPKPLAILRPSLSQARPAPGAAVPDSREEARRGGLLSRPLFSLHSTLLI